MTVCVAAWENPQVDPWEKEFLILHCYFAFFSLDSYFYTSRKGA